MRIRSTTLASLVAGSSAIAIATGCSSNGGGGFAQTNSSSQGSDQSGSSSSNNNTGGSSGGSSAASSSGGGSTATSGSTSTSAGSAAACAFPDGTTPSGNFPFPQGKKYTGCTYPTSADPTLVCNAYKAWYNGITTTTGAGSFRRVFDQSFDSGNSTSEGIAYGMLIAVYMSDHMAFDAFWGYAQAHMSNGLMSWHIGPTGNTLDPHSATDADEDMAWSLVMADKQWGGSYLAAAKSMLGAIKSEFSSNLPTDGDFGAQFTHPDYAAPDYSATFQSTTGDSFWGGVSSAEYAAFSQHQTQPSGMIPDSISSSAFGFDACRAPWRTGVDFCWHGTSSATTFLNPMIATFKSLASASAFPGNLQLPLTLQGQPNSASVTGAIIGPAAVGAMISSSNQAFIDSSWSFLTTYVKNAAIGGKYGTSGDYFGDTLGLMGLLVMSGNFSDFTK